jgi:N-dimethylarginine dimethylaminohydrolase
VIGTRGDQLVAMARAEAKAHFLMGHPRHFAVTYSINPWMDPQGWAREERALAAASGDEWEALRGTLQALGARIEVVPGVPGLPDLVFTANSAVVLDRTALLARFRHPERQAEEPHFAATFHRLHARGLIDAVRKLPDSLVLEGAGDCVWDSSRRLFWMGYGQRSDAAARHAVEDTFGVDVVALELADPRFYHLDTALCPLPRGDVIWLPEAFTEEAAAVIRDRVSADRRIEITMADAGRLAANAVCIGDAVVLVDDCSDALRTRLQERGYRMIATPLTGFRRSGGAAFCLTLRLDWRSGVAADGMRGVAMGR